LIHANTIKVYYQLQIPRTWVLEIIAAAEQATGCRHVALKLSLSGPRKSNTAKHHQKSDTFKSGRVDQDKFLIRGKLVTSSAKRRPQGYVCYARSWCLLWRITSRLKIRNLRKSQRQWCSVPKRFKIPKLLLHASSIGRWQTFNPITDGT
jgi:hypothetical protein